MENWFGDLGRNVLFEALVDACDQISDNFKADFQAYTQNNLNLAAELENLRHKASQVERLEEENTSLKAEVKALKEAGRKDIHDPNTTGRTQANNPLRTPLAPRSVNQLNSKLSDHALSDLKAELLHADKKHGKLHGKYLDLQDALDKSRQLLRERTAAYHQWVNHAEQLKEQSMKRARRIKKLEAKLAEASQESLNLSFSSDAGDVGVVDEPATLTPIHPYQRNESIAPIPDLVMIPQYRPRASALIDDVSKSRSPVIARNLPETSHSSLILETGDSQRMNKTSCLPPLPQTCKSTEEEIQIKAEPSSDTPVVVSERCVRKRKNIGNDKEDTPAYTKVKIEHNPEPMASNERRLFAPHESIDFDAESPRVRTPKKHMRYQRTHHMHNNSPRPTNDEFRSTQTTGQTVTSCSRPQANDYSLLQSLNDNDVFQPRSNLALDSTKRKSAMMPRGLASLAEDGNQDENTNPSDGKNRSRASVLAQLLSAPSSAQKDGALQSGSPVVVGQRSDLRFQIPKKRELPFGRDGRKRVSSAPKGSLNVSSCKAASPAINRNHDTAVTNTAEEKRRTGAPLLRQLPKAKLRLDDFKINPHANEGYDYAFTDVVRNKDERACLQGCVKENCCGYKFRPLAHAARARTRPYEFQSLLESYLGDDCHRLSTMSEVEKEALWVEAKIRELANESGKHRHRFPRMSTPPGFWRTDFPSTQEGEEYNEEAVNLEREIIEERYREAMRPRGLWIFRDE
ncbi:SAE2-domain-containing protein [Xylariaceae sp. AK1471]|nr:SAE2-domain-containing protein [Xylariaceae sp. AK1471]